MSHRKPGELVGTFQGYRPGCRWIRDDNINETIIGTVEEDIPDGMGFLSHTIRGTIAVNSLKHGLTYRFWGRMTVHEKYGEQFHFEAFTEEAPATHEAVCLYLQQCDGIGPATAEEMFSIWKENAVDVLRSAPEKVAERIKRLSLVQCQAASELLTKRHRTQRVKMDMMALVHKAGIPKKIVDKAIDKWGVRAAEIVRRNPYRLMAFRGIGFLKTDRMWLDFGLNPLRMKRQALACWYSIARDNEGHVWFPEHQARDFVRRHISSVDVNFDAAMELAVRGGLLERQENQGRRLIAEKSRAIKERKVAQLIEDSRNESLENGVKWPSVADIKELAEEDGSHQREQLQSALGGVVSFLAGSPGTGKTFTAAALIKTIMRTYPHDLIAAAAPTGKAAVRLTESLEKCGVKLRAKTIHSMLGIESQGDDGFGFQHTARNPLPFKFVLFDEASMMDVPLFAAALEARPMGGHYLILGDPNQLAPVGYGAPLRDLLECPDSVPMGVLSEIRRNSGQGVLACAAIREKQPWSPSKKLDVTSGENLLIVNTSTPEDQIEALSALIRKFSDQSPRKYDPTWDVQVVCAVNKRGLLSRRSLNPLLQELLNPDGEKLKSCPFRVGDKIVNLKNGWLKSANPTEDETDQDGRVYVANGEQAKVIEIAAGVVIAELTSPPRTVIIHRKATSDTETAAREAMKGDEDEPQDGEGGAATNTGCSWDLGYAISAHKSQGSEWPVVIVMLDTDPSAKRTCSRQWLYTAISRFKDFALLIGTKRTADSMCVRDALFSRKTMLRERINELRRKQEEVMLEESTEMDFDAILEGVV